ncbi:uncharacterized protein N7496_001617 [Penicillium cataractarum]|uniref:Enoyl reductase (ER) domain-containing protein n=1 Tax=Penicillium cataractarum TaxID=2100454 RepID=A0A9W9VWP5_9EURO|nr:uncharacterized protein N7496_001617 [Penicillium cataractarum]KAJ5390549.1 hypothetical protein N7496_001617 [Penicillium cataractarum]
MTEGNLALVSYGPISSGQWKLESVIPRAVKSDELLIRMVATGICRADIHFGDFALEETATNPAAFYPRVMGHEGAGYVEMVGSSVKGFNPGDPVILSIMSCGECYNCDAKHPAYCTKSFECNFLGDQNVYASQGKSSFDIAGAFFGQSSFSAKAIVKEVCVVNLKGLEITHRDLQMLAPIGCSVQTGAGAFTNIANVQQDHDVAVLGVGGVGMSAIMAAAIIGCKTIIAIDNVPSRLHVAKSLGATHAIDTSDSKVDLVAEVLKITDGRGVHVSLDTTGVQRLARQWWNFVRFQGKVLQVGLAKPGDQWNVSMADHMNTGRQIIGCVQGDSIPQIYLRDLVSWYLDGKLPVDKMVRPYPIADWRQAVEDMQTGTTIKPVLVWPDERSSKI